MKILINEMFLIVIRLLEILVAYAIMHAFLTSNLLSSVGQEIASLVLSILSLLQLINN